MEEELQDHKEWVEGLERGGEMIDLNSEGSGPESDPEPRQQQDPPAEGVSSYLQHVEGMQMNEGSDHEIDNRQTQKEVNLKQEVDPEEEKNKRWNQLYELNKIQKETKEYFHQAMKQNGEVRELEKCTFKPKLNKMSKKILQTHGKRNKGDFYKRKEQWQRRKQEKIKQISESKQDKELLHCTFQPQIIGSKNTRRKEMVGSKQAKALDKYVERQRKARLEKERKKAILNGDRGLDKNMGKGNTYTAKYMQANDPEDPALLNKLRNSSFSNAVLSLHRHLNSFDINLD